MAGWSRRLGLVVSVGALVASAVAPSAVLGAEPPIHPDAPDKVKLIVTFERGHGRQAQRAVERLGGKVRRGLGLIDGLAVEVPRGQVKKLRADPAVATIETDGKLVAFDHAADTGDLEYENAWGVEHIGTREAHLAGLTGQGIKLAVIDTGLDYIHDDPDDDPYLVDPEFNLNYAGGYDFFNDDADPYDDNGHGTHVSGIAAAQKNGYLVVGVAPDVDLYALKVLSAQGEGEYSGLIAALDWAVANDMDVVNMSLGGHEASAALQAAVANAYAAGVTLVAASGNVNPLVWQELLYGCPVAYPAAYDEVIAVSFTGQADKLTGYSCTGPQVDLAAPGDAIYSTVPVGPTGSCMFCTPYGYSAQSGTSMASPHVAGVVALLLQAGIADDGDGLLADDVKAHLCANTMPAAGMATTDPRYPNYYGCGIVDADLALIDNPPAPPGGPSAVDDVATVDEDGAVDIAVLANDTDPDGGALTVTSTTDPANGTASINPDGTVHYVPDPDHSGTDAFAYTIENASGEDATATVAVTVNPVNDPPVAVDDDLVTSLETATNVDVVANDTDIDGDALAVTGLTVPTHGFAVMEADGTITYTPDAGYTGADAFSYTVSDGAGGNDTGDVFVTVVGANSPPDAVDDVLVTDEDTAADLHPAANDSDPDGGDLVVTAVTQPAHGTTLLASDGTVTYTPTGDYAGPDAFDYTVADSLGLTDTASVAVTVTPVNDEPVAVDDSATVAEDDSVVIDVVANDTDVDGDALSVATVGAPGLGSVAIEPDGTVRYTPLTEYAGADSFVYTVSDGAGGTAEGSVAVTVTPVNDPPTADDKTVTTAFGKRVAVPLSGGDAETCQLSFAIDAPPSHGTLATISGISCAGTAPPYTDSAAVWYTPATGYSGPDSFTYRTSDGTSSSAPATVSITVGPPPKIHVGDLDRGYLTRSTSWIAIATVRVHTETEGGQGGVKVTGVWSDGVEATGTCNTTSGGCQVKLYGVPRTVHSVRFTVTSLSRSGFVYDPAANHEPDGDSDGTSIVVLGP